MTMPQDGKYAALPDLDEAPDVYETPDLTDDTSTLQTSTAARSPSPSVSETSETQFNSGINRHRLQPTQARSQFRSSRVDAREADFSDRVSSKRRAYRVSGRRWRGDALVDGNEEGEDDWASEDDDEGLDRRLARLIREAQEVQSELDRRRTGDGDDGGSETPNAQRKTAEDGGEDVTAKFRELNLALEKIRDSQLDAGSAHARLAKQLARGIPDQAAIDNRNTTTAATSTIPEQQSSDAAIALSKVADFDSRLASLERSLGVSSLDTPEATSNGSNVAFNPVLPTLSLLDRQVTLLSSVPSQPHLDAVVQRLQQAQAEQQQQQHEATHSHSSSNADNASTAALQSPNLTQGEMAKLRSLYAILPQLTSLAPTLPPLLARLRSLRTLHATAAAASQTLDRVERRQDDADKEIKEWAAGLAKVAEAVKSAEGGMRENVGAVDAWVKELEARVAKMVS